MSEGAGEGHLVDPSTAERLVNLRFLLEEALQRVTDRSVVGRHTAIVLLDGACELAMGTVLDECGLEHGRTFEDAFSKLGQKLGDSWQRDGWEGVHLAHRARNEAQHCGIIPDFHQLQNWAGDADRFVRSLIAAGTGNDLRLAAYSLAVSTEDIRRPLANAEAALEEGRLTDALDNCRQAFEQARQHWRGTRARTGHGVPSTALLDNLTSPVVHAQLAKLDELLEVLPFSLDLGEYLWFLALPQGMPGEPEPTAEQVTRAMAFVFSWVVRWEAFSTRYDVRASSDLDRKSSG